MKAAGRSGDWLVRVSGWGRVSVHDSHDGREAELVHEIDIAPTCDANVVLALATRWQRARHHGLLNLLHASAASDGRAMRLCWSAPSGSTIDEVAQRHGPMSEPMVAALAHDLCAAIVHAHGRELVVGLAGPGQLYLATPGSEGVSALRVLGAGLPALVEACGNEIGASAERSFASMYPFPGYVAPEVAGGREPSAMSDVFSLAATLAGLLLGRAPFDSSDPPLLAHEMAQGISAETADGLDLHGPTLAPALRAALSPSPLQRAGALSDLRSAIAQVLGDDGVARVSIVRGGGPWAMGSPIIALAAWAGSGAFADRFADRSNGRNSRSAIPHLARGGQDAASAEASSGDLARDGLAKARLETAMRELDVRRALVQRDAPRRRSVWVDITIVAVVLLVACVIVWVGSQRNDAETALRDPSRYKPFLMPPKTPPKPHRLSTWPPPERDRR